MHSEPKDVGLVKDAAILQRFSPEQMQKVNLFETEQMFCDLYCLQPGQAQKVHAHQGADKVYFVLSGTATVVLGDAEVAVGPQTGALAPADVPHGVRNDTDSNVVCLVFMAPNPNG